MLGTRVADLGFGQCILAEARFGRLLFGESARPQTAQQAVGRVTTSRNWGMDSEVLTQLVLKS
jgi:hypothetical protein